MTSNNNYICKQGQDKDQILTAAMRNVAKCLASVWWLPEVKVSLHVFPDLLYLVAVTYWYFLFSIMSENSNILSPLYHLSSTLLPQYAERTRNYTLEVSTLEFLIRRVYSFWFPSLPCKTLLIWTVPLWVFQWQTSLQTHVIEQHVSNQQTDTERFRQRGSWLCHGEHTSFFISHLISDWTHNQITVVDTIH